MLRISKFGVVADATVLRLDGSLAGAWVDELRRLCETSVADGQAITLDCGGISFIDSKGIALMRELRRRHVSLTNCSPFLMFQLQPGSTV
jgi:anti-anti-sigma factor